MGSMSAGSGTVARTLRYAGLTLAAGLVGGAVLVAGAGTTSAPEPANLGAGLGAWGGATAAATFVYSQTPTTVVNWTGSSWSAASWLAVGTPCSTGPLPPGATTTKTIQAQYPGSANKKCL